MHNFFDIVVYEDDFHGYRAPQAAAAGEFEWVKADTSSGGSPTVLSVDGSKNGAIALTHDSTNEIQNLFLYHGDHLNFDLASLLRASFRIKVTASLNAATSMAWGLTGDRNDAIDSVAQAALFRIIGNNTVVVETDDGTHDNDDVATGQTVVATYKWFVIDFTAGVSDVRFFMGDANNKLTRVARNTTFDMSAYTGSLQPFFQNQKTAATSVDALTIDAVRIESRRAA